MFEQLKAVGGTRTIDEHHGSISEESLSIMSMGLLGTFWFITVLCFSVGNAQTFVIVDCTTESVGQCGKPTMLECLVHFRVTDVNIVMITWKKEGVDKPLLVFKRNNTATDPGKDSRYRFADEPWNSSNTNVSLLITNTEMTNAGKYKCTVITDRGFSTGSTNLRVTAKYNQPVIRKIDSSGENGYVCHSDGGYPQGQLRWIVNNERWQQIIETNASKSQNGLYNLSSKLTLTKDSRFSKFTCEVINGSGVKENEATHEILDQEKIGSDRQRSPAEIVAPLVVIGSLIVGLLLVLFFRRRSQRQPQGYPYECDAEHGAVEEMGDKCEKKSCLTE